MTGINTLNGGIDSLGGNTGGGTTEGAVRYDEKQTLDERQKEQARTNIDAAKGGGEMRYDESQNLGSSQQEQARQNIGAEATGRAVRYDTSQSLSATNKTRARANIGAAASEGEEPSLVAGDLTSINDRVTVSDKFVIRTTAGDESIDSGKEALLLEVKGGCGQAEADAFKINALRWNGANQLNPAAWEAGMTNGYILGEVSAGAIKEGTHKLCIVRCPQCGNLMERKGAKRK